MSQKRKPVALTYAISITPGKRKKVEEDEIIAVLAPFNPFPKLCFEDVKLHKTVTRDVTLKNPTNNVMSVVLTKLPDSTLGFQWSATEFDIPSQSQSKVTISWTPQIYGSWRYSVKIINKHSNKTISELIIISSTEEPPRITRRCLQTQQQTQSNVVNKSRQEKAMAKSKVTGTSTTKCRNGKTLRNNKENTLMYEPAFSSGQQQTLTEKNLLRDKKSSVRSSTNVKKHISTDIPVTNYTPRRDTYEVLAPVSSSRRSTYSLRSQQLRSIVEEEKLKFESFASPGVHNESLETAASKLADGEDGKSTYMIKYDNGETSVPICHPRRTTFEVATPSVSKTKLPSSHDIYSLEADIVGARLSLDSQSSSSKFYDSLEEVSPRSSEPKNNVLDELECVNLSFSPPKSNKGEKRTSLRTIIKEADLNVPNTSNSVSPMQQVSVEMRGGDRKSAQDKLNLKSSKMVDLNQTYPILNLTSEQAPCAQNIQLPQLSSVKIEEELKDNIYSPNFEMYYGPSTSYGQDYESKATISSKPIHFNFTQELKSEFGENAFGDQLLQFSQVRINDKLGKKTYSSGIETHKIWESPNVSQYDLNEDLSEIVNLNLTQFIQSELAEIAIENKLSECSQLKINEEQKNYVQEMGLDTLFCNSFNNGNKNFDNSEELNIEDISNLNIKREDIEPLNVLGELGCTVVRKSRYSDKETTFCNSSLFNTSKKNVDNLDKFNAENISNLIKKSDDIKPPDVLDELDCTVFTKLRNSDEAMAWESVFSNSSNFNTRNKNVDNSKELNAERISNLNKERDNIKPPDALGELESPVVRKSRNSDKLHSFNAPSSIKKFSFETKIKRSTTSSPKAFFIPTECVKRPCTTLLKSANSSPPKISKMTLDPKVKRLATPVFKKPLISSLTDLRKKGVTRSPKCAPRPATVSANKRKSSKVTDWLPVRRLRLSTRSSSTSSRSPSSPTPSQEDPAVLDPYLVATTLNPFEEGGLYLSEEWIENEEQEVLAWANHMMQPPSELQLDRDQSQRPTLHRLNTLRQSAFNLLVCPEVTKALSKVHIAVNKKIICIRPDKEVHVDLGLQDKIVCLLMSYNPLWLRLCLESIYKCSIPLKRHSDDPGLIAFIRKRVVCDAYIKETYSHPTVPHLMLPEFEDKMKKFTLYKFLVIVYYLDFLKSKKVILHNPCLFRKDSKFKSSKEVLLEFNKEFVTLDLIKVLRLKGYEVSYSQTYLDEFDFTLKVRSELRDGVRLTKLAEILVGNNSLCPKLRLPAISLHQKKFNAEIAFNALKTAGFNLPENIEPKDISNGHKEKTLSLLWHLRGIIQKRAGSIITKWWLKTKPLREDRRNFLNVRQSVIKIQKWYRRMKHCKTLSSDETKQAREDRENFLKLKSVAITLQQTFKRNRGKREKNKRNSAATIIQKWYRSKKIVEKERYRFMVLKRSAIIIQKAYRRYKQQPRGLMKEQQNYYINLRKRVIFIQRRFREKLLAQEFREKYLQIKCATLVIQRKFRAYAQAKADRTKFLKMKGSAGLLQQKFRATIQARKDRKKFLEAKASAVIIQRRYKAHLLAKADRLEFLKMRASAVLLQQKFRAAIQARTDRRMFLAAKSSAVFIQRRFRAHVLAKADRAKFLEMKASALHIQRKFKAYVRAKADRTRYLNMRASALVLQQRFRATIQARADRRKFLEAKSSAVLIQRRFRALLLAKANRTVFLKVKASAVLIQRRLRAYFQAKADRTKFLKMKTSALLIQQKFRATIQARADRRKFLEAKSSAVLIQRRFKAYLMTKTNRTVFLELKALTVLIQRRFRANLLAKTNRTAFLKKKASAVLIQRRFRAHFQAKADRTRFLIMRASALTLQQKFRATIQARADRRKFLELKSSAVLIQRRFRALLLVKAYRAVFLKIKASAVLIQIRFRAYIKAKADRTRFLKMKTSALLIQQKFRSTIQARAQRRKFLQAKSSAVLIQRRFKTHLLAKAIRSVFLKMKASAVLIQRRFRAYLLVKADRTRFLNMRASAVVLQQKFRATIQARAARRKFLEAKFSAVLIQRRFRAYVKGKADRTKYLKMKTSALLIQRKFRSTIQARAYRRMFLEEKSSTVLIQRRFRAHLLAKAYRSVFLKMKASAVLIQRSFRAYIRAKADRTLFLKMKASAVLLQLKLRATIQARADRKKFLRVKSSAVLIQRRFRACLLAKANRSVFLKKKTSALIIQRRFRAYFRAKADRTRFLRMRASALLLQKKFRANIQARADRRKFLEAKSSAVLIQRRFRAHLLAKATRSVFLEMKASAVLIQRRFRAYSRAKADRKRFLNMRSLAVVLQQKFRAKIQARTERKKFLEAKTSAVLIQRRYRAHLLSKANRAVFLKIIASAVLLQQKFRATIQARVDRRKFLEVKSIAVLIQRRFRANILAKANRSMFLKMKASAILIQRHFRTYRLAKNDRTLYLMMRASAIFIQRKFRAIIQARADRRMFLETKSSAILIQRAFRAMCLRRNAIIQMRKAILQAQFTAAVKIQALWRGKMVRRRIQVPQPKVTKKNSSDNTINNRAKGIQQSLHNLLNLSVAQVQDVLYHLDVVTLLSAKQCQYFATNHAVTHLFAYLKETNKSFGTGQTVELSLMILCNLFRAPQTANIVWQETVQVKGIELLLDLMMSFRMEKTTTVFCKAATLLWLFARDPAKALVIMNAHKAQDIIKFMKKKITQPGNPGPSTIKRTPHHKNSKKKPSTLPNWGNYFCQLRSFEDKHFAFECLCSNLNFPS